MKHLDLDTLKTALEAINNLEKTHRVQKNGSMLAGVQFARNEVMDLIIEEEEFRRHEVYSK